MFAAVFKNIKRRLTTTIMTSYMTRDNSHDDAGPFEDEGFKPGGIAGVDSNIETNRTSNKALEGAVKIRNTVHSRGEIATDAVVEDACPVPEVGGTSHETMYYLNAGPVASTHPELRWASAWRLDDDAPAYKSDAWKAEASELEIPEHEEFMPKVVRSFYEYLEAVREEDGRPAHREELVSNSPALLRDRQYDKAFRYLEEFSGVVPPTRDGPAWERIDDDATGEAATEGSHA